MTTVRSLEYWQTLAAKLTPEGRAVINGKYLAAADSYTFDCISPIDQRVLAKVASCKEADVNTAVNAARAAFNSGSWSQLAPKVR